MPNVATPLTVVIAVQVAADGSFLNARVVEPSVDSTFDRAAMDAALHSRYSPAAASCKPVPGVYTFVQTLGSEF